MSITVSKLCTNAQANYNMKLFAGKSGLDNYVRWVHLIENGDISTFLHGNEMLFTTGIGISDSTQLPEFVGQLIEKRCSALVLNIGPYIKSVPEELIDYCDINSLPLFTVPWNVRLIDITYDFCHRIVTSEEIETATATAMRNLIFSPETERNYKPTLERRSFFANSSYCVSVCAFENDSEINESTQKTILSDLQKVLNTCGKQLSFFFQDKRLVTVFQDVTIGQVRQITDMFRDIYSSRSVAGRLICGTSPVKTGYSAISGGYHKALMALKLAVLHGADYMNYDDMGIYKLLVQIEDTALLTEMYNETLKPLEEFDAANNTDYMNTLKCYLENDSSVQEVAKLTFVHRNTVNYKLRRIKEILGCQLTYEDKLKLMLAFFIKELL